MKRFLVFLFVTGLVFVAATAFATSPQRYTDGVTTAPASETMGQYILPDRSEIHEYWNDFNIYTAADWLITTVETGTGSAAEAITDILGGGWLELSNVLSDNDSDFLQLSKDGGTTATKVFTYVATKKAWFKTRFQANLATQIDLIAGVHIADTTPIAGAPSDGIWFVKDDGDTNIDLVVGLNSAYQRANAIATLAVNTSVTLGYYWDGIETLTYFVNDVKVGSMTLSSSALPSDEIFAPGFGVQNGQSSGGSTMVVDYIWAAEER